MIPPLLEKVSYNVFFVISKRMIKLIKKIYSTIYPSGSQPARIYGLPKMHKIQSPNAVPPFRPIVSSVNTFNYQLATNTFVVFFNLTCLMHILFLILFLFVQELETIDFSNKFMVLFDVVSLFTNIPLKESIDLAVSYISEGNPNLKLSKADLTKFFHLLRLKLTFFSMVKMYDQILHLRLSWLIFS